MRKLLIISLLLTFALPATAEDDFDATPEEYVAKTVFAGTIWYGSLLAGASIGAGALGGVVWYPAWWVGENFLEPKDEPINWWPQVFTLPYYANKLVDD